MVNRPKHQGYVGKKPLPGIRSPWLQQQLSRQQHKIKTRIIIPIIVGGTVIITIWNHKVLINGRGNFTFCTFFKVLSSSALTFLHPLLFETTIEPGFLQKYDGIFVSGLSILTVGLGCHGIPYEVFSTFENVFHTHLMQALQNYAKN